MPLLLDPTSSAIIVLLLHFIPLFLLIRTFIKPDLISTSEKPSTNLSQTKSWASRLFSGLSASRAQFQKIQNLFEGKTTLNQELLEQLHESLYRCDLGPDTTDAFIAEIEKQGQNKELDYNNVLSILQTYSESIFVQPEEKSSNEPLQVILMVGVNGAGKTTTTGKLASKFIADGKSVILGAADTFRAAASEQLEEWAKRIGCEIVKHKAGGDPAAVACDTIRAAQSRKLDVAIIDTAGRLHNKSDLMDQLNKIRRVIDKECPGAPHETWLVLDATTGQNALPQVEAFKQATPLTGLIMTKLDGTAKGGALISISHKHHIPIRYIGVGESAADLEAFQPKEFTESLFKH